MKLRKHPRANNDVKIFFFFPLQNEALSLNNLQLLQILWRNISEKEKDKDFSILSLASGIIFIYSILLLPRRRQRAWTCTPAGGTSAALR